MKKEKVSKKNEKAILTGNDVQQCDKMFISIHV